MILPIIVSVWDFAGVDQLLKLLGLKLLQTHFRLLFKES